MPHSIQTGIFNKLPQEVAPKINFYFTKLGKDFIYGFDLFKDSTIKIYIRNKPSEESKVDIEESLSYYPKKGIIQRRKLPIKDTILNDHWQYWTRFNKQDFFINAN